MNHVRVVEHKGKQIVLIDMAGCNAEGATRIFVEARPVVALRGAKGALTLTDVRGTAFDTATIEAARATVKLNQPYVKAAALVGVEGLKETILTALVTLTGRDLKVFGTREQALDWLVEQ